MREKLNLLRTNVQGLSICPGSPLRGLWERLMSEKDLWPHKTPTTPTGQDVAAEPRKGSGIFTFTDLTEGFYLFI